MLAFLVAHQVEVLAALLAVSEVLAFIPGIKSGGVLDLIVNVLKAVNLKAPEQK